MTELLNRNLLTLEAKDPGRFIAMARETEGCILLTAGEPDFGISDIVKTNVTKSLNLGQTHYSDPVGDPRTRISVTDFEKRTKNLDYSPDEVIITVGGTEAVYIALQGILNPGDEVVIPVPAVNLYENAVRLAGAVPVFLDTTSDGYQINGERLSALMTDRTRVIVINSPNNPTGVIYNEASLQAVHDAAAGKPVFVLSDEVYNRVVYDEKNCPAFAAQYPDLRDQVLTVQSFSNTYAMAGFRVGYLMGAAAIIEKLAPLHRTAVNSIVNFIQDPAINAIHSDIMGMVWAYDSRRKFICERLDQIGLDYTAPEGGFYVFPSIEKLGMDSETFCTRLIKEAKVAVLPGSCYGVEGRVRISYSAPMGSLRAGLIRLENFVKSL